jgi:apolipoprotein N-acyltransferase
MNRKELLFVPAALAIGGGLWFVMNLNPIWWLAWILPGLLFAIALRTEAWTARGLVALAALIGASSNLVYYLKVMPLMAVMIVLLLQTLVWVLIFEAARRIVKGWEAAWTVLALPVVSVAVDTLLARFTPDGNFGSLAYTQAEMLPVAQFAALFGTGGILFLLMLANSALAFALTYGVKMRAATEMYAGTVLLIALAAGFGVWRLQGESDGPPVSFGIASVDDFIDSPRSAGSRDVWTQYEAQVQELAGSGAKVVLLP